MVLLASMFGLALLAPAAIANPIDTRAPKCYKGAYIIAARGSTEPAGTPGDLASFVTLIKDKVPRSHNVSVDYPADNSTPAAYAQSVAIGVNATSKLIQKYTKACGAESRIALLGFSQGAQVMSDLLGGTNTSAPLAEKYRKYLTAITLFGDPHYILPEPIDAGNSTAPSGRVPRPASQDTQLNTYSKVLRSWCSSGDYFCDDAANMTSGKAIHLLEVPTWQNDALAFLAPLFGK